MKFIETLLTLGVEVLTIKGGLILRRAGKKLELRTYMIPELEFVLYNLVPGLRDIFGISSEVPPRFRRELNAIDFGVVNGVIRAMDNLQSLVLRRMRALEANGWFVSIADQHLVEFADFMKATGVVEYSKTYLENVSQASDIGLFLTQNVRPAWLPGFNTNAAGGSCIKCLFNKIGLAPPGVKYHQDPLVQDGVTNIMQLVMLYGPADLAKSGATYEMIALMRNSGTLLRRNRGGALKVYGEDDDFCRC